MPATRLVIIGAGGFGREVLDVVDACNAVHPGGLEFLGFLDDGEPDLPLLAARGAQHLGRVSLLNDLDPDVGYVIGIGAPQVRRDVDQLARAAGRRAVTLVHPSATMGFDVQLGEGSVVCAHVSLTTNIRIGRHVHLNLNCTVGHDVLVGDFCTVYPGVNISGGVVMEDESSMGTNSCVLQGLRIGTRSFVGAGAAVVRDIPAGVTAVGVPAKWR